MFIVKFLVINVFFLSGIVDRFLFYDIEFIFNIISFGSNPQNFRILSVAIVNSSSHVTSLN